jgi:hypothetical protein
VNRPSPFRFDAPSVCEVDQFPAYCFSRRQSSPLILFSCRCLDFLTQHVVEFSLQRDESDCSCHNAEVATARIWIANAAPPDVREDAPDIGDGSNCIAASYVVAYDQAFGCPVCDLRFNLCR